MLFLLVLLGNAGAPPPVAAGPSTRLTALAGGDVVEDAADPLRWYGALADAGRLLYLTAGDDRAAAPGTWRVTRETAAVFAGGGSAGRSLHAGLAVFHDRPDRSLQGLLGGRVGGVDLVLSAAWRDRDAALPAADVGRAAWEARDAVVGVGARWAPAPSCYVDLAADADLYRRRLAPAGGGETVTATGTAWTGLRGRLFVALAPRRVLSVAAAWEGAARPDRVADPDGVYRRVADRYDLRLALLLLPDPDTLWHVTLGCRRDREQLRDPGLAPGPAGGRRLDAWLLRAGGERRLSPWCVVRGGATVAVADPGGDLPGTPQAAFVRWDATVGAALVLGEVVLDVAVGDDLPALPRAGAGRFHPSDRRLWTGVTLSASF